MNTKRLTEEIETAAEILRGGGLVAVPTETVYGLACNGLDEAAVRRVYEVKGRPPEKALSLMVADAAAMERYCHDIPPMARRLAQRHWPGALTLILPAREDVVPTLVRAGGATVGLRCPDHALTQRLLRESALPLAAPSANPSGAPSPKTAAEVLTYFDGAIDAVIDGGACSAGRESTILDLSRTPYRILRQGAIGEEALLCSMRESLTLIGITGGSGCGKTTALKVLRARGALILDCDEIYHELTEGSAPMRAEIIARFGAVYDGEHLDRHALGAVVFHDAAALRDLGAITHKYVDRELERRLTEHALHGGTLAAIDAIALLENRYAEKTLCNIAVTAPEAARIARLMQREGVSEDYARSRIAAQKPNAYFSEHCDYTLENSGTMEEFEQKCDQLFREVLHDGEERK